MLIFGLLLWVLYLIAMGIFGYEFFKIKKNNALEIPPETRFSVIIPFRDEAENLPKLLQSILNLKYPSALFEVIFVDDASEDTSAEIILKTLKNSQVDFRVIENQRSSASPKKDALTAAINFAKHEWILTTDADCQLPENWLRAYNSFILEKNPMMVCGPVLYAANDSFIEKFQQLDGFSLQTVMMGSFGFQKPLLCNGANLGYKKEGFFSVNGFHGNTHIGSGDDIFMLEKMKIAFPGRVLFLKNEKAIVATQPQNSWESLINQRLRWASKTAKQKNRFSKILGMLVFAINLCVLLIPLGILFQPSFTLFFLSLLVFKMLVDYFIIGLGATFFEKKVAFPTFVLSFFVYAFITVIVVLKSFGGTYHWKGRVFEKQA